MTRFSDKPFNERMVVGGDTAENAFRRFAASKNIEIFHYGMDNPPFSHFDSLPEMVKGTPDFVCEGPTRTKFFVECKGFKGSYVESVKPKSLAYAELWNALMTVWFFIYNSRRKECAIVSYRQMVAICEQAPIDHYSDGNPYYKIPRRVFTWEPVPKEQIHDRPQGY